MTKTRLEAFSDGVLAIIITILVLELKVPHGETFAVLTPLLPAFLAYVLSFVYVGIYWNNLHHMLHAATREGSRAGTGDRQGPQRQCIRAGLCRGDTGCILQPLGIAGLLRRRCNAMAGAGQAHRACAIGTWQVSGHPQHGLHATTAAKGGVERVMGIEST
jgi:hypothetical protein